MNATLTIRVANLHGKSFLEECFYNPPFKVANITGRQQEEVLRLMIMSSSPGVLDTDRYSTDILLRKNSQLHLHTQSYQRIFTMQQEAGQHTTISLEPGSTFCYLPHPVVPHSLSNFVSQTDIHISEGCRLLYGEVLTCGRKLNGEVFSFSRYHSLSRVFLNNKLVLKENLLMEPAAFDLHSIGQLQGYTHQASLIYLDEKLDINPARHQLLSLFHHQQGILAGVSEAPVNGLVLRLLGQKAEQLFGLLNQAAGLLLYDERIKTSAYAI